MSVVVVATIVPLPDQREAVIAAFEKVIAQVHQDDEGCELYALHETREALVMIEKWASKEALAAHGKGAAVRALNAALKGKTDGPTKLQILRPHPAGTAGQGTL